MEFQFFDLESISELGLAPELLQPEDLLLGVPDVPAVQQDVHTANSKVERAQDNFDSFFTTKEENVKDLGSTLTDINDVASFDLFSFMDMGEVTEVATVPTTKTTILDDAMEECGIGSPASSNGEFSPLPPTIHIEEAKTSATDIEKTQELINDVESYLKSVDGTPTSLDDDIQTTFQDIMAEDNKPITVQGNPSLMDEIDEVFHQSETYEVPVMEYMTTQEVTPAASTQSSPTALLAALANGKVSVNDSGMTLTEEDLSRAYTTTMVTEDGENMVIIIAPPSPASPPTSPANSFASVAPSPGPSLMSLTDYDSSYDTDPDYSPRSTSRNNAGTSGNSGSVIQIREKTTEQPPRRKYQRRKPPQPPAGPYPTDKKERKKAQNRTAAFRYREKKKQEQEMADGEVEALVGKNTALKAKLNDVENEVRILKKLMAEAGLGKYANVVKL